MLVFQRQNRMKILHIVAGEMAGGAARGAYWLHQGLLKSGVDSRILTNAKGTYGDRTVVSINGDKKGRLVAMIRQQAESGLQRLYRNRKRVIFSTGLFGYDFTRTNLYKQADIIHLHWICGSMVNIRHLARVKKPMVWTMRDMWPMTGGCHYTMECENYIYGCGKCPQLGSSRQKDLSRLVYWRKKKYLPRNMKLVGISHWLSDCAKQSALFQGFDVRAIHNNVSTQEFFPVGKSTARQILGLPAERPVVLAGAQNMEDFYKGFDTYLQALKLLNSDTLLLFFGKLDQTATESLRHDYVSLGFLHDTVSLRLAYSAADVFVAPSRMDAFGKTLAESMACGTPVVCFDATGPKDIVDHKKDGYKAKPFEAEALARGINWVLEDADTKLLSSNARQKVVSYFDSEVIASQYVSLYKSILDGEI
ncbi:MAG: glycosyltransferase family 4 protein [Desulfobacteraceae bacterium]|nr:glycosyltransferase family 4 protein [Desulfobacteraceae bacterium]